MARNGLLFGFGEVHRIFGLKHDELQVDLVPDRVKREEDDKQLGLLIAARE